MKSFLVASAIFAGALSHSVKLEEQLLRDLWDQWKISHQKVYSMSEENNKFNTFAQNYLQILEHNALNDNLTLGLNAFADLTNEEFNAKYLGLDVSLHQETNNVHKLSTYNVPDSVDWRQKGAVNEIKNQKNCGSCWSFSAIASLEALNFKDTGKLESFSEQNLVDCCKGKCLGCKGGLMTAAFDYSSQNGIQYETDYPYTAANGKCVADRSKAKNVNVAYNNVQLGSADQLKAAIAQQVVSVAVEAGGSSWQFYKGGVISGQCTDKLNHGVAAVGYGSSKGSEAYIVRNSWGPAWGDAGYVHISTDESANKGHGVCGILLMNSYPTSK